MKKISILIIIFIAVISFVTSNPRKVYAASDLDDKIGSYTDDSISSSDKLGGEGINVKYTILNAKSKAKVEQNAAIKNGMQSGTQSLSGGNKGSSANINSVEMGAGSVVRGPIIIIDESRGKKTAVAGD
ncbi:MAG: hypothetical protein HQK91_02730 [Nitrospirae bacterium]|nr:hypothetical protein [Nitrospirota bacterium]